MATNSQRLFFRKFFGLLAKLCLLSLTLCVGCSDSSNSKKNGAASSTSIAEPDVAALKLLGKMRAAYRDAKSYADNSVVVFSAILRATGSEQFIPYTQLSVAFERPNKLQVTQKQFIATPSEESYELVSDGRTIRSATDSLAEQVQEGLCPLELSAANFIPDPVFRAAMLPRSIENLFPQLALLFAQNDEQPIFPGELQPRMLAQGELEGQSYDRVEITSRVGKRVLWLDQKNHMMRRMEIPIEQQLPEIDPQNQFSKVAFWIDFENATFDSEIQPEIFQLAVPKDARLVRRFIPPPPPGPPEHFGKPIEAFSFRTIDGEEVTQETLANKVVILDFWGVNCPPCKAHTPILNDVYNRFKDNDEVAFLAVHAQRAVIPNEAIAKTMLSWGGEMPVLLDPKSSSYYRLDVQQFPTLILIDRQGRLQDFQLGQHRSPEPLTKKIQALLDGENLIAAARTKHDEQVAQYEEALDASSIEGSLAPAEIVQPEIPPRQLPKQFQLEQLWQTSKKQLQSPGDIMILPDSKKDAANLLVLDDGNVVVGFDSLGNTVSRYELPEHEERKHGFLRGWENSEGQRWYLASGVGWQKVFVWGQEKGSEFSFPDESHSGVGDVLLADPSNAGTPTMYVGYWGGRGVQAGAPDGRQLWSNNKLDHVLQVTNGPLSSDNSQTLWCTSTRGTLVKLGLDGKQLEERYLVGQTLSYLAAQPNDEAYCGLSADKVGQYAAVGFDPSGDVDWEYPLPVGEYLEQIPRVQSVSMPGGKQNWLVAAANGSLFWLDEEGALVDRFDTGAILTGVAMSDFKLFIATTDSLTVWQLKPAGSTTEEPSASETESSTAIKNSESLELKEPL